jgi:hypothetical protein
MFIRLPPSPVRACRAPVPFPFPVVGRAACPCSLRRSPVLLGVTAHPSAPFPARTHRAVMPCPSPSLSAPRALALCVARFLVVRPSPITVGAPLTPPWPLGHTCCGASGLPRPSQGPTSLGGASGAHAPWLAAGSHPNGWNRLARPSLSYVVYVCFKYFRRFRCMLQLFYFDVAKVVRGMLHMLHILQLF